MYLPTTQDEDEHLYYVVEEPEKWPWFFGKLDKREAESLLRPKENGLFLVYEDRHKPNSIYLVICCNSIACHYKISSSNELWSIDNKHFFKTLSILIAHHSEKAVGVVPRLVKHPQKGDLEKETESKSLAKPKPVVKPKPSKIVRSESCVQHQFKESVEMNGFRQFLSDSKSNLASEVRKLIPRNRNSFATLIDSEMEDDEEEDPLVNLSEKWGIKTNTLSRKERQYLLGNKEAIEKITQASSLKKSTSLMSLNRKEESSYGKLKSRFNKLLSISDVNECISDKDEQRLSLPKFLGRSSPSVIERSHDTNSEFDYFSGDENDDEGEEEDSKHEARKEEPKTFIAIYDYQPTESQCLPFNKNDILTEIPLDANHQGWIYVTNNRGSEGYAPSNYLELVDNGLAIKEPQHILEHAEASFSAPVYEKFSRIASWIDSITLSNSSGIGSESDALWEKLTDESTTSTTTEIASAKASVDAGKLPLMWTQPETVKEVKLHEAMFEVITSEESYLNSLKVLINHFYDRIAFMCRCQSKLKEEELEVLFSNILQIKMVSEILVSELQLKWQKDSQHIDVCSILLTHMKKDFSAYLEYANNYRTQVRCLEYMLKKSELRSVIQKLEGSEHSRRYKFESFLVLPIQRIVKYPLLIEAIMKKLPKESQMLQSCEEALAWSKKLALQCDTIIASNMLWELEQRLKFPINVPRITLWTKNHSRWVVKEGVATLLTPVSNAIVPKWESRSLIMYKLTDMYLFCTLKSKSQNSLRVLDYCLLKDAHLMIIYQEGMGGKVRDHCVVPCNLKLPISYKLPAQLTVFRKVDSFLKAKSYIVNFSTEKQREDWLQCFNTDHCK